MRKPLPKTGLDWETLDRVMSEMASGDIDWRRGRVPIGVTYASEGVNEVSQKAFIKFFTENASLGKRAFFSVKRMEEEVIDMGLELLNAPLEGRGSMTTGGSESIILAMKACREWARAKRRRISTPNIIVPYSAHPAFNKASKLLDIEERRIPVGSDYRAEVTLMAGSIDEQTIMLVGSAPCFPHGVIDPIAALGQVAQERGIWLHVDACGGGYFAPFVKKLGYGIPDFDFSIAGVRSISADLHKLGYCAKPASTLFYRDARDYEYQIFEFEDWPSGQFLSPTLSNTRSGGAVAAAWAVMHHLGEEGYLEIARRMMSMVRAFIDGVNAVDGLTVWGNPDLSIVTYGSEALDIYAVAERMAERGWMMSLCREPRAIHTTMTLIHEPVMDEYLSNLQAAVEDVQAGLGSSEKTSVIY